MSFDYEARSFPYQRPTKYTPDFFLPNGIIVEAKGYFKSADRTKHLRVREQYPHLDIRFVFQDARKRLGKTSSTTYGDWCDRYGFLWAEKSIPMEWLK